MMEIMEVMKVSVGDLGGKAALISPKLHFLKLL